MKTKIINSWNVISTASETVDILEKSGASKEDIQKFRKEVFSNGHINLLSQIIGKYTNERK